MIPKKLNCRSFEHLTFSFIVYAFYSVKIMFSLWNTSHVKFVVVNPHHLLHLVLYVFLICCLTRLTAVPVLSAVTTPQLATLSVAATNSVSKREACSYKAPQWEDLKCCCVQTVEMLLTCWRCCGCYAVSMDIKGIKKMFSPSWSCWLTLSRKHGC